MRVDINDIPALQAALDENGLPDKIAPTRDGIELYYPEGGGCLTITLGDLTGNTAILGNDFVCAINSLSSIVSGGTGPYIITSTSGAPAGMDITIDIPDVDWIITLAQGSMTSSDMGFYNVTINVEDANGCPGSRIFAVAVGALFSQDTPVSADSPMTIAVSGMPATIGTGVRLEAISVLGAGTNLAGVGASLDSPSAAGTLQFFNQGDLSGTPFFYFPNFVRGASDLITDSSGAYSGAFSPSQVNVSGFDVFTGNSTNGNWSFYFDFSVAPSGDINQTVLIFKPLP